MRDSAAKSTVLCWCSVDSVGWWLIYHMYCKCLCVNIFFFTFPLTLTAQMSTSSSNLRLIVIRYITFEVNWQHTWIKSFIDSILNCLKIHSFICVLFTVLRRVTGRCSQSTEDSPSFPPSPLGAIYSTQTATLVLREQHHLNPESNLLVDSWLKFWKM